MKSMSLGQKAAFVAVMTIVLITLKIVVRRRQRARAEKLRQARAERRALYEEAQS